MSDNNAPPDSGGSDDEDNDADSQIPAWLAQLKVVLEVALLVRKVANWLLL